MAGGYEQYAGRSEEEAFALLTAMDHGMLSAWDGEAGSPLISFLHHAVRPEERVVIGHLANPNPLLARLEANPRATYVVSGPSAYIPSYWRDSVTAVPTSYYAWAQLEVEVNLVRAPESLVELLREQMERLQPEGRHAAVEAGASRWKGMLGAITGLEMRVLSISSRFKYGQNRTVAERERIVERLRERGRREQGLGVDAAVADRVIAHLPASPMETSPPGAEAGTGAGKKGGTG